ncbi:MAG: undecaprenyldiphospho-muramoylpentapeptide beta-N-acetylglucosaminyltransferase [Gammaproteobacteria bacterium]|nr:undecaprenyldiphospho-muramoylpentapeptide beta-N-acetylglucosaminyltransferase [Gammaproteobacteria bacterium]MCY4218148.1 undecaprenyldiphospho-muramoylpentapeptide beta-N-acetylglucosaminyltransferase [Gammaproteobacteria bacterium]MCY4275575.1 undecaprenyldiphospho-muramoylpentapeptide beta-N-acetylglucosaminyltransferase [Gammaproteobacteria bacterium]
MTHIMILAGGTGGHVMPALAVAEELAEQQVELSWVGSEQGLETRLVPLADIPFDAISIKGLRGRGVIGLLKLPFMMTKAMTQVFWIIRKKQPDAIIGMGGFVSGPGALMGVMMGFPILLHEQNSIAGWTNKFLARIAKVVMSGFPSPRGLHQSIWTGNPVRNSISKIPQPSERLSGTENLTRILVLGGSQGAAVFNRDLPELLAKLKLNDLKVWHQCGRRDVSLIAAEYERLGIECQVEQFIDNMADAYTWSHMVICRAGAMTIAEICCAGVAAILVPYPHAVDDHQAFNAEFLVNNRAGLMFDEQEWHKGDWLTDLKRLLRNPDELIGMASAARALAKPEASRSVAKICLEVACANS